MRTVLIAVMMIAAAAGVMSGSAAPAGQNPFESAAAVSPRNRIDELVFARLEKLGIPPARLSSDAVFLRRAYLDAIGTLPTVEEAKAFLADRDPDKRAALVDRLLEREEFADFWAMRWCEVLRVKSEFPINLWPNAVQAYHRWIRAAVRDNVPFDRFARDLLTSSGSNFREPPVNFYRALQSREPQAVASAVALTFMGARAEAWPPERLENMAAFFSQVGYKATGEWKEEIVFFDADKPSPGAPGLPRTMTLPDGTAVRIAPGQDPREAFAAWLTAPANPSFARAMANRIWFWLLGRGIVEEADDLRPDNPPSNPELLAYLERELVASRFDPKHLIRLVLNSTTYQLSSASSTSRADAEAHFAFALVRPLEAEVLADAISRITGVADQYSSAIPEPYTFVPPEVRAVALPDGSITSTFLETFGRSPRDSGRATESRSRPTASQRLYLLNSADIQRKIQQGPILEALMQASRDARDTATNLYLAILSRMPTDDEVRAAGSYAQAAGANRRAVAQDLAWTLINSTEFRFRH